MTQSHSSLSHLRTALFVDFDNIYLRLQQEDPRAAEQFATNPARWLEWLREKLPYNGHELSTALPRKILFRRCYLNPSQFGRFRPDFSRAAFEVVDCPPLTSGGKTSSDIHMVMDILDALHHDTHFDEFIILSGDADFTPVLLRLSKHDRTSVVLAIGPASTAYKAASDLLIDEDTFLEEAIGVDLSEVVRSPLPGPPRLGGIGIPSITAGPDLLRRIADKVYERASALGELVATDLPSIYREFPEFTASTNWLGFNSLRSMTWGVVHARPDLTMIDGDPWKVRVRPGSGERSGAEGGEFGANAANAAYAGGTGGTADIGPVDVAELTEQILDFVRSIVESSDAAIPMARVAQEVIARFGDAVLQTRWAGAGTFRDLLGGQEDPGFTISSIKPGYVYDPDRHQVPVSRPDDLESTDPELAGLAYRIHQLTDAPYLSPPEYGRIFRLVAEEVNQHGYFLHRTSKAVRDRCIEDGSPVARSSVNFILRGIAFAGHRYAQSDPEEPLGLAAIFARNVAVLCESAGFALSTEERQRLFDWITGDLRHGETAGENDLALAKDAAEG
ncbi:MAG TPA: NYN domain-containing protein [Thermoanaerobaculia bacterium]|nr:NYN domain-containing protein [Thermoanaerobaculia bacterium]